MKRTKEAKIYEALSAIIDKRVVEIDKNTYHVLSSDHSKYYTVINEGDLYTSNDNATYWQHYAGYPIIAVMIFQGKLSFDTSILPYFVGIPWHNFNEKNKRDYQKSIDEFLSAIDKVVCDKIMKEMDALYPEYGYAKHKGYPTKSHIEICRKIGPSPIQRNSFKY